VHQVQHGGGRDDGRLHDLPQLRRFEVRLTAADQLSFSHALGLEFPPAT
jgi:hypothetical protein